MRVNFIIQHLIDNCPLLAGNVHKAVSLVGLDDDEIADELPIAFVYPGKEHGEENESMTCVAQIVPKQVHILIAAKNSGSTTEEPLEDVRDQIKQAMLSLKTSDNNSFSFVVGDIDKISTRIDWWKDTFDTYQILTNNL